MSDHDEPVTREMKAEMSVVWIGRFKRVTHNEYLEKIFISCINASSKRSDLDIIAKAVDTLIKVIKLLNYIPISQDEISAKILSQNKIWAEIDSVLRIFNSLIAKIRYIQSDISQWREILDHNTIVLDCFLSKELSDSIVDFQGILRVRNKSQKYEFESQLPEAPTHTPILLRRKP